MIKRILVPVDFSPASQEALDFAVDLAGRYQAEMLVLHVVEPVYYAANVGEIAVMSSRVLEAQEQWARAELVKMADRLNGRRVACRTLFATGTPHREIVAAARQNDVGMIVMSTHGRTGFSHLLMGSVAEKVVRTAECPVLTIRSRKVPAGGT